MEILTRLEDIGQDSAVAIGKFDGIHQGHRLIIDHITAMKKHGLKAVVFTFFPSPAAFFSKSEVKELYTPAEKREAFSKMGVDILIECPFDEHIASYDPTLFVKEVLCEKLHAKLICAGEDVSFGKGGKGNLALLKEMSKEYDYHVHIIDKLKYEGTEISSTVIRELITHGDMHKANAMLGTPFSITGKVVNGAHKGTDFGIPTVNLLAENGKILPPDGVYCSTVKRGDKVYEGITNIGMKPTVSDENVRGVETHLYSFDEELYGETITVSLFDFLRKEAKFSSVDALIKQMEEDKERGRILHEERKENY